MSNGIVQNPSVTETMLQTLFDSVQASSYRATGAGNFNAQYQTILSRFDRFGYNMSLQNHEVTGLTFITRPKLNFSTTSLRQDRILATIDSKDPNSLAFALRCYLDTKYAHDVNIPTNGQGSITSNTQLSSQAPFFNDSTPFIVPLTNCLTSISGWPDPVIVSETTQGGFFSEKQSFAKGSDRLNDGYDFTLTFRDIQGGFIMALFTLWLKYMDLVTRGEVLAYAEDIAARRLNYTCSIYRFVLDPSRRYITKWAKATGCYPTSVPLGAIFNIAEKENFITAAERIPIPFRVNKVEYMDPIIFRDFNTIMTRFAPNIQSYTNTNTLKLTNSNASHPWTDGSLNFVGIPWINAAAGNNELQWMAQPAELAVIQAVNPTLQGIQNLLNPSPTNSPGGQSPPTQNNTLTGPNVNTPSNNSPFTSIG